MSTPRLKITLAQLNPIVGDVLGNVQKIRETYLEADQRGVDLVITPELAVTGYPLEDLVNTPDLLAASDAALENLRRFTKAGKATLVFGAPLRDAAGVYNAAFAMRDGEIVAIVRKKSLPNYGIFDEMRNFVSEEGSVRPFEVNGVKVGMLICEDVWMPDMSRELTDHGAQVLVAINASPFRPDILQIRVRDVAALRVAETGLPLMYVNTVGGQDEVVFDGGSFAMDSQGRRALQLPQWEECVMDYDLAQPFEVDPSNLFPYRLEEIWNALVLGVRDYVRKSGFKDVVLGLSGGMDSALVAAVAGDALGAKHVHCVRLPSRYTSDLSNDTAEEMCKTWGFSMDTMPIEDLVQTATGTLSAVVPEGLKKLTTENMQARARGYLLMTVSNDRGWLLLATGNKSEIAMGYATLYGDMCGGYCPLKDVYKTTVYALAKWRNANRTQSLRGPKGIVIPVEIIERPPSAELAPDQLDTDTLPPYPLLDAILAGIVEQRDSVEEIIARGYKPEMVYRVYRMLKRAEYKRRQGAPGPKTTFRAFTRDRRIPIVNGFDPAMAAELRDMK